jgi:hypothetical protein
MTPTAAARCCHSWTSNLNTAYFKIIGGPRSAVQHEEPASDALHGSTVQDVEGRQIERPPRDDRLALPVDGILTRLSFPVLGATSKIALRLSSEARASDPERGVRR